MWSYNDDAFSNLRVNVNIIGVLHILMAKYGYYSPL